MDDIERWLTDLGSAWSRGDPVAISRLFSPDVVYQTSPFREPLRGRDAVADYWASELESATLLRLEWGAPLGTGHSVAVEWRAHVRTEEGTIEEAGVLLLEFESGSCVELREYWMLDRQRQTADQGFDFPKFTEAL